MQVARKTLPQSVSMPGSSSINIELSDKLENNKILATFILDLITYPIKENIQWPKSKNSLKDSILGNLGLNSFQNHTVNKERSIPTTICCRFIAPETAIQNINKNANKASDLFRKI